MYKADMCHSLSRGRMKVFNLMKANGMEHVPALQNGEYTHKVVEILSQRDVMSAYNQALEARGLVERIGMGKSRKFLTTFIVLSSFSKIYCHLFAKPEQVGSRISPRSFQGFAKGLGGCSSFFVCGGNYLLL